MIQKPKVLKLIGGDIRNAGVRARLFMRVVGPKRTEFDYWIVGFRLITLFVFLERCHWGQMRFSVEWRGKMQFARAWRWKRVSPRPVYSDDT